MFIFMYSPYAFAEALKLSGIMAILFAGIVMSHYTHYNLSSVTRVTVQQIFRTLGFISETCVFAYLGLAIFSYKHIFKPSLVISSIVMCLVGRACNIFPLAYLVNYFRQHKITKKMQFIMWFSGLRGAIAFALSLNLNIESEVHNVIVTSTLILVLFTTIVLGGSTMPLMNYLNANKSSTSERNNRKEATKDKKIIFLSKTIEMDDTIDSTIMFDNKANNPIGNNLKDDEDMTGASVSIHIAKSDTRLRGFARLDEKYLKPLFIRNFTDEVFIIIFVVFFLKIELNFLF
jgi:solute carrier family 9 (sodium/hydrogen exchanger), member 8